MTAIFAENLPKTKTVIIIIWRAVGSWGIWLIALALHYIFFSTILRILTPLKRWFSKARKEAFGGPCLDIRRLNVDESDSRE